MGSVPTIVRHASRNVLYQFDGMTPTTPLHRDRRRPKRPASGSRSRCRGE